MTSHHATAAQQCPLCASHATDEFHRDKRREYHRCSRCQLTFVPAEYHLSTAAERSQYDLHQNDPHDPAYRKFLGRLFTPIAERLPEQAHGLDFGSGPGPTLSLMLEEVGFPTSIYDPYYAPQPEVWLAEYDFVTCSEVVEHLHRPRAELQRLWNVLKSGGWLGVMTKRTTTVDAFAQWHYKNDPTHVIFFAEETFRWLANYWSAQLEIIGPDVILLQKPLPPTAIRSGKN